MTTTGSSAARTITAPREADRRCAEKAGDTLLGANTARLCAAGVDLSVTATRCLAAYDHIMLLSMTYTCVIQSLEGSGRGRGWLSNMPDTQLGHLPNTQLGH